MHADVAILGSGFAGSLCALIAQQIGLRPVLIDKAAHPRFAIGESSTPIANMILRDLAVRYDLPWLRPLSMYGAWQQTYPNMVVGRKRGFSYFHHEAGHAFQPDALHANELLVAASSDNEQCDTHWLRADLDAFLADNVRAAGIPFFENANIEHLDSGPSWTLKGQQDEEGLVLTADFVIDGTGGSGVVPQSLGIARDSSRFYTHSRALFSHVTQMPCWHDLLLAAGGTTVDHPFPCDDAALHHVLDGAWLWMLRFNDGRVSVGLMQDGERYPLSSQLAPVDEWSQWMQRFPSLQAQFQHAQLAEQPGYFMRTSRLQRRWTQVVGTNWALLPHTAGFVDPLHSTGIAHSLCGVERLMAILAAHWGQPTLADALGHYQQAVTRELAFMDRLVAACYRTITHFDAFIASTMLYFAAVIAYERQRAATKAFDRFFLCADDDDLFHLAITCVERAPTLQTPADVDTYGRFIEDAIAPYNTASLFRPDVPNMYHHTVAPYDR